MSEWQGRTVWVSGAAQGIGHAVARTFAEAGASVVAFDLQLAEALPGNVKGVVIDVSDSEAVTRCCEQLLDEGLGPDVLVNVAGILATGRIDEVDDALLQRTFAINTFAPFYLMRALTPWFQGRLRGAIVNVSSNAGRVPRVGMGIYGASKAALTSLTQTAGLELAPLWGALQSGVAGLDPYPDAVRHVAGGGRRRSRKESCVPSRACPGSSSWGSLLASSGHPTRWLPACCFSPPMPPAISPCRIWWSMAVPLWGSSPRAADLAGVTLSLWRRPCLLAFQPCGQEQLTARLMFAQGHSHGTDNGDARHPSAWGAAALVAYHSSGGHLVCPAKISAEPRLQYRRVLAAGGGAGSPSLHPRGAPDYRRDPRSALRLCGHCRWPADGGQPRLLAAGRAGSAQRS